MNSYDHTTKFYNICEENQVLFEIFKMRLSESRIFYHFASVIMQCQNDFPQFSNDSFMASNFEEFDLGDIITSSCFFKFKSSLFENFGF